MLTCIIHWGVGPLISYIVLHIFVPYSYVLYYTIHSYASYIKIKRKLNNCIIQKPTHKVTLQGEELDIRETQICAIQTSY